MSSMPAGVYIQGNSVLHRMNASLKLFCFLTLSAAAVMANSLWGYILMTAVMTGVVQLSGIPCRAVLKPILRLWLFFAVIFVMNTAFFQTEHALWSWWIFHLSWEGMAQGANVILRVILIMALSGVLTAVTTPIELTGAIEAMLLPLKRIRVPVDDAAMILGVAVQFIPTFVEEADIIKKAQTARGAGFESRRLRDRSAAVAPLIIPIFLSAFRRADELAAAMEARGYRRAGGRTKRRQAAFRWRDMAALAVSCIICAVQILL